jgi:hypothetical protein
VDHRGQGEDGHRGRNLVEVRTGACGVPGGLVGARRASLEEIRSSHAVELLAIANWSNPSATDRRSPWAGRSAHPSLVWCSLTCSFGSPIPFPPSRIPHRRPEPRTWRAPASLLPWFARAPPLACSREEESAWVIHPVCDGYDLVR